MIRRIMLLSSLSPEISQLPSAIDSLSGCRLQVIYGARHCLAPSPPGGLHPSILFLIPSPDIQKRQEIFQTDSEIRNCTGTQSENGHVGLFCIELSRCRY